MPIGLKFGADARNNAPVVLVQAAPEAIDALGLMRHLKQAFPVEWSAINMEFTVPEEKKLILKGDLPMNDNGI